MEFLFPSKNRSILLRLTWIILDCIFVCDHGSYRVQCRYFPSPIGVILYILDCEKIYSTWLFGGIIVIQFCQLAAKGIGFPDISKHTEIVRQVPESFC